ncbi:hypothetical protein JKG47_00485 [Acidithiobacillus sp. MC6.1]|nr:hypothetical protein [Acidithiobacillus sp. MC6.1]
MNPWCRKVSDPFQPLQGASLAGCSPLQTAVLPGATLPGVAHAGSIPRICPRHDFAAPFHQRGFTTTVTEDVSDG